MPIYEYCCAKCGEEFEELVFDETAPACPRCGSSQTSKLMSCCCHKSSGGGGDHAAPSGSGGGGGCAGCSGGNCASCGH